MKYWFIPFIVFLIFFQNASYLEITRYFPILFMLIFLTLYKVKNININAVFRNNSVIFTYIFFICIGLVRNNATFISNNTVIVGSIQLILFVIFVIKFLFALRSGNEMTLNNDKVLLHPLLYYIIFPVFIFQCLNFLFLTLNVRFNQSALGIEGNTMKAVTLSYLGLDYYRIEFPLADGLNGFSVYIGGMLTIILMILFLNIRRSIFLIVTCLILLIALLLVDSRASYVYPFLITIGLVFWYRKRKMTNKLALISFITIVGPFLYMILLPLLFSDNALFSRGDGDLTTGNERFIMWGISLSYFSSFKFIDLIGFGHYGHYGSGVSQQWGILFKNWTNSNLHTPHNTMFSIIFDYGYLGLFLYILLFYQLFKRSVFLSKYNRKLALVFIAFLIYCVFQGITETLEGFYSPNFLYAFIIVALLINHYYYLCILKERKN